MTNQVPLAGTVYLHFGTSSPTTGAATNADLTPVVTVAQNGTDIGYVPTVTNVASGLYKVALACTSGNGFSAGSRYSIYVSATVGGITGRDGLSEFEVLALDLNTGVASVSGLVTSNLDAAISSRMATYSQPTGFLAATFPSGTIANTTNITAGTITTVSGNVNGSVGSVSGLAASNLDAAISSRMATYTQPTGFLAAAFPSGTVASTINITAGTITTVTTLTNLPAIPNNWLTASGVAAAALNGKGDWNVGKTGYSISGTKQTLDALNDITSISVWGVATRLLTAGTNIVLAKDVGVTGFNDIAAAAVVSGGPITTSGGKVSGVLLTDTVTTYTGNTLQTGDSFVRIGASGVGLSAVGDTAGTTTLLSRITAPRATNLDNLDATVSSRSVYAGSDTSGTTTLLSRVTATRAGNLDNLDVSVNSRFAASGVPSNFSSLSISSSGIVAGDIKRVNNVLVQGAGSVDNPWGP